MKERIFKNGMLYNTEVDLENKREYLKLFRKMNRGKMELGFTIARCMCIGQIPRRISITGK